MGYTHYWRRKADLSFAWSNFIKDVKIAYLLLGLKGCEYTGTNIAICGPLGKGKPIFNENKVSFNGCGDLAHETFKLVRDIEIEKKELIEYYKSIGLKIRYDDPRLPQPDPCGYYFDFCKTGKKPYDFFVCTVLTLASIHFGTKNIIVYSDGTLKDWQPAISFVRYIGYDVNKHTLPKIFNSISKGSVF